MIINIHGKDVVTMFNNASNNKLIFFGCKPFHQNNTYILINLILVHDV